MCPQNSKIAAIAAAALILGDVRLEAQGPAGTATAAARQSDAKYQPGPMLAASLAGPMRGVEEIVFAVRGPGRDGHYYANFGHYDREPDRWTYGLGGGKLCTLNLRTGRLTVLLDDRDGGVRDPCVSYDGKTVLFSYRPGGSRHYHLYEIGADGMALRQLTRGDWDDIEPVYLPDGDIVFTSSRCNRFVACWYTPVAILYRCRPDGGDARMLSSSIVHDNTPWVLPDGRILYTRWEYVDRNRVSYHHLWTIHPDGTGQMVYYGNQQPGEVYIDAKPIPGSRRVACIFSPGHGMTEHDGQLVVVDPRGGPDAKAAARRIVITPPSGLREAGRPKPLVRDPWPFSEDCFLVACARRLLLVDGAGQAETVYELPADERSPLQVHEPRPLIPHPREPQITPRTQPDQGTGQLILANVLHGRNLRGVAAGEIKKLLVLEQLPKPVNLNGTVDHNTSLHGTFTLKRILGTVPVEADGSAYLELPALRSLFFVALDERELAVKRMQSFVTLQPGEVTSCAGCHEERVQTPRPRQAPVLAALRGPPRRPEPIPNVPDVIDFPRDIQPVLDKHCTRCHGGEKTDGGVDLTGESSGHRVFSRAYMALMTGKGLVSHGQDGNGNRAPRRIGSSASRLLGLLDGAHYGVRLPPGEKTLVRLWIECGAFYPGTCAAMEVADTVFHMPGFRPNRHYIREMQRYGLLPATWDPAQDLVDVYALDQAYWRSLWYKPRTADAGSGDGKSN